MINYDNNDNSTNTMSNDTNHEIKYEIIDTLSHDNQYVDKNEISNLLNDENFFFDPEDEHGGECSEFNETTFNDDLLAQHIDYLENYNLKMLHHICKYYNISKTRLKKNDLIELITQFENEPENSHIVYNRKRCWHYIHELKSDPYFSKFIVF